MQPETLKAQIASIQGNRSQMIVLTMPEHTDASGQAQKLAEDPAFELLNVGESLSEALLDVASAKRPLKAASVFAGLVQSASEPIEGSDHGAVVLDRIQILFEPSLKLEPMNLLEGISRNVSLLVIWPGTLQEGHLIYAKPGHPEYKKYPTTGVATFELNQI